MSNPPPKTIIITGISPHSPLSTHIASLLLSHFTTTTTAQPPTLNLALLGPSLSHLTSTATQLNSAFQAPNLKILPFEVPITSAQSIGQTAHSIRAEFGAADIVIHNAPAFLPFPSQATGTQTPIRGADEDEWWEVFEVNVRSIQFVARHFFTKMREGAVFVNVVAWMDVEAEADAEESGRGRSAWEGSGVAAEQVMGHLMRENRGFRCHSVYVRQGVVGSGAGGGIDDEEWRESAKRVTAGLNCW